ncbi:MAG: glycosyltransferase family 4 protein [Chlorobi bacterium]|nr:glycosyltransferase family 4 protein [Chlorobiota bacterium]
MTIGFEAKRVFFNYSGLGNYSRNLIDALVRYFPGHKYLLYTPPGYQPGIFQPEKPAEIRFPEKWSEKKIPALWRSLTLSKQVKRDNIDLFHGLSAELPGGIIKTGIPSIVTIHDLIFLRYPGLYPYVDRKIYQKKANTACKNATRIIAISEQTKDDITHFLNIDTEKIDIAYQSCHEQFFRITDNDTRLTVTEKYNLPSTYILYVGTIEERKNLLGLVKAIEMAKPGISLVVAGKPRKYAREVKKYIQTHRTGEVIFIESVDFRDLPALYQMASLFVYPSFFEGFGIPIIEALVSGVPVITSRDGCFAEAGGPGSRYVDPHSPESIAEAIKEIISDHALRNKMIQEGRQYVSRFSPHAAASSIIDIYEKTVHGA